MIEIYLNPDPNAGLEALDPATEPLNDPWQPWRLWRPWQLLCLELSCFELYIMKIENSSTARSKDNLREVDNLLKELSQVNKQSWNPRLKACSNFETRAWLL